MFWRIKTDLINRDDPECDRTGVSSGTLVPGSKLYTFKLYDDDGEHYFTGECDAEAVFADEGGIYDCLRWQERDTGCTDLRMKTEDLKALAPASAEIYDRLDKAGWQPLFG